MSINNVDYIRDNFQAKKAVSNDRPLWDPVKLPGDDYIAGPELFPSRVIAGFNADYEEYDAESWAIFVLRRAQTFSIATACSSFSGNNSGSTGGRYWFGYVFRGGPVDASSFEKASAGVDAAGARAFSIEG